LKIDELRWRSKTIFDAVEDIGIMSPKHHYKPERYLCDGMEFDVAEQHHAESGVEKPDLKCIWK
jgi:hypothetical protein